MQQLILHHYPMSPFAEKMRLILGFKGLHWSSVHIPNIMPKPDLTALTGGYRKTPVLQIGADIYCDTALIADVLEERAPSPTLYPSGVAGASRILAQWADSTLFWTAIPFAMQPAGLAHMFEGMPPEAIKAFGDDRAVFRANMPRMRPADANAAFALYLERLGRDARQARFLFRNCAQHRGFFDLSLSLVRHARRSGGENSRILLRRCKAGAREWLPSAMARTRNSTALPPSPSRATRRPEKSPGNLDSHGIAIGERVVAAATDTGIDPIEGTLYGATKTAFRSPARIRAPAGWSCTFPRLGFELRRAK